MSQGPYDHPSYLTRQQVALGKSVAGANGTSCLKGFPLLTRLRNVAGAVVTAGTSATTGNQGIIYCLGTCTQYNSAGVGTVGTATTSLGVVVLGTSAVGVVGTSGDLNTTINTGSIVFVKNGTDATGVTEYTAESHVDAAGTWSGSN